MLAKLYKLFLLSTKKSRKVLSKKNRYDFLEASYHTKHWPEINYSLKESRNFIPLTVINLVLKFTLWKNEKIYFQKNHSRMFWRRLLNLFQKTMPITVTKKGSKLIFASSCPLWLWIEIKTQCDAYSRIRAIQDIHF